MARQTRLLQGVLLLFLAAAGPAAAQSIPRSILVIDQSDVRGPFYYEVYSALRSMVNASSKLPATIYSESLDLSRFFGPSHEENLQLYFRAKYGDKPIGVIVAIGDASLDYVMRWRSALWPGVPVVFSLVDETTVARLKPPSDVTGSVMKLNFADAITAARAVVPNLNRIVVVGDAWEKQTVFGHWKNQIPMMPADVEISEMIGLTMRELRQQVARLPDRAAIVYTAIYSDGEGIYFPPADALGLLAETANRPIVIPTESNLGRGGIGGFVMTPALIGQAAAELALRILGGERASSIPIREGNVVRPIFDWRQMQRWGVSESSLPSGSEVRFREPKAWEQYRTHILLFLVVSLLQAALICWLIYEHRRRQKAEVLIRNTMAELTQSNRMATAGQLSASIAHEVSQPLTGIVTQAGAALRWLAAETPDIERVRTALSNIVSAGHRTSDVVTSVRNMFTKASGQRTKADINQLISAVLDLVEIELQKHEIEVQTRFQVPLPPVIGDPIQIQQVILNLVMNAMEAMHSIQSWPRVLLVKSELGKSGYVNVSIEDSGPGISPSDLQRIFQPLFTTKGQGIGMGLAICQSIIASHNGELWVTPASGRGSIFQFSIPVSGH